MELFLIYLIIFVVILFGFYIVSALQSRQHRIDKIDDDCYRLFSRENHFSEWKWYGSFSSKEDCLKHIENLKSKEE